MRNEGAGRTLMLNGESSLTWSTLQDSGLISWPGCLGVLQIHSSDVSLKLAFGYRFSLCNNHSETNQVCQAYLWEHVFLQVNGWAEVFLAEVPGQELGYGVTSRSRVWSVGLPLEAQKRNVSSNRLLDKQECSWPMTKADRATLQGPFNACSCTEVGGPVSGTQMSVSAALSLGGHVW